MEKQGSSGQPLRVCFFIPDFRYGGAQKQCILLLNELQLRSDVEVTLVRFAAGPQDHLLCTDRLNCVFINIRSNFDLRAILAVRRVVAECEADVLVSWLRVCDIYSYFVRLLRPRTSWVMTQRNSRYGRSWLFRLRDLLGKRADAIASNSSAGAQLWESKLTRAKIYVVENIAEQAPPLVAERNGHSILYVGRLKPQKNVITMMRAFAILAKDRPDIDIWVCGDGELKDDMRRIAEDAGVSDKIEFAGFRADVAEWMSRAKVLVSLSEREGKPNVLMEGTRADCIIVASSIPEHTDFLGSAYPFLVENFYDPIEAADVITRALDAPQSGECLQHARVQLSHMEPGRVAAQYVDIFRNTMAAR